MLGKVKQILFWVFILLNMLFMTVGCIIYSFSDLSLKEEITQKYTSDWKYIGPNDKVQNILLPVNLDVPKGQPYTVTCQLPSAFQDPFYMRVRISYQTLKVKVNGKEIYQTGFNEDEYIGNTMGSYWKIIKIPEQYKGSTIQLTFTSDYSDFSGLVNDIVFGSKSFLLIDIIHEFGLNFIFYICILVIGIALIFVFAFLYPYEKEYSVSLLYLAIATIFMVLWLMGESRMLQFIIGNHFLVTNLALICIPIFSSAWLLFIGKRAKLKQAFLLDLSTIIFICYAFLVIILQVLKIIDFFTMVHITNFLLGIIVIEGLGIMLFEIFKYHNERAKELVLLLMPIYVSFSLEIVNFFSNKFENTSRYMLLGLIISLILITVVTVKKIIIISKNEAEKKYYEKLAFQDYLTGINNRAAIYRDLKNLSKKSQDDEKMWILILDINDLKLINDVYGHAAGDEAIITCGKCMEETLGELGNCYRIGGDEFACIIFSAQETRVNNVIKNFKEKIDEVAKTVAYPYKVAVGVTQSADIENVTFEALAKDADLEMYRNKKEIKEDCEELLMEEISSQF